MYFRVTFKNVHCSSFSLRLRFCITKLFKSKSTTTNTPHHRAKSAMACPNLEVVHALALAKPNNDDGNPNN